MTFSDVRNLTLEEIVRELRALVINRSPMYMNDQQRALELLEEIDRRSHLETKLIDGVLGAL